MPDSKAEQLAALLRQQIVDGGRPPGTALPSLRRMAEEFGVAVNTARQALSWLCGGGFVNAEERDAYRVSNFERDGVLAAVRVKLQLAQHTPRAGKMVQELLALRKPLVMSAMARLLTSGDDHPYPITVHLGPLQSAQMRGYVSLVELLRAEEWIWEKLAKERLGEVEIAIAQFARACLDGIACDGFDACTAPKSLDDWQTLEAAIVDKQYARAMRMTERLLSDREPLWQLLATTAPASKAEAH